MGEIQPHVDWTAGTAQAGRNTGTRFGSGLGAAAATEPVARRDVMETLLGKNDLAALDASGGDPYNATGRHFRR
jgi:hypothetical protein